MLGGTQHHQQLLRLASPRLACGWPLNPRLASPGLACGWHLNPRLPVATLY